MLVLYLVRHGQTTLNKQKLIQGWSNSHLTEKGIVSVKKTGKKLSNIKFSAVYTSDLERTIETAKIILDENIRTDKNIEINSLPELRELNFGSFDNIHNIKMGVVWTDGIKKEILKDIVNNESLYKNMINNAAKLDKTGEAEDYDKFSHRILTEIFKINREVKTGNVLFSSHGMVINMILNHFGSAQNLTPKNASVSKILFTKDDIKIDFINR